MTMADGESTPGKWENPAENLPWEEILALQADDALQRKGRRRYWPSPLPEARPCPGCGRPAGEMAWIYFTNGPDCWMAECGLEGWIVACMDCRRQADFFPTLMN
jgi:hypothetical protein